jgi:hypothetical protein
VSRLDECVHLDRQAVGGTLTRDVGNLRGISSIAALSRSPVLQKSSGSLDRYISCAAQSTEVHGDELGRLRAEHDGDTGPKGRETSDGDHGRGRSVCRSIGATTSSLDIKLDLHAWRP